MRQSVVISDRKLNSFGVISDSTRLAAAAGFSGVACASRGHHPPLQEEQLRRVAVMGKALDSSGFLSAFRRRTVPRGAGLSSLGYGG